MISAHYQLEQHDVDGWRSLGPHHAFRHREAAYSDLRMQARHIEARLRIRETTTNRIAWMANVTAYDEQLNGFRMRAIDEREEFERAIVELAGFTGTEEQQQTNVPMKENLRLQIDACDAVITAIDKIF